MATRDRTDLYVKAVNERQHPQQQGTSLTPTQEKLVQIYTCYQHTLRLLHSKG